MANEDIELTVLAAIVDLLSRHDLDDVQRRRIINYASSRCIKPEERRIDQGILQSAYANQVSNYKGQG
jgi:hypothetical protein